MSNSFINVFTNSLATGFIDKTQESEHLYRPMLLVNKKVPKEKVLSAILQELNFCNEFCISVAFVTTSGIAALLNSLIELEKKGVKGKVLVSQYLNFTQPEALKRLLKFKNIDLKIATTSSSHSKGYIFKTEDHYNIIIGSSNWTSSALTVNKEWNLKVSGLHSSEIVDKVLSEFESDFKEATRVDAGYISEYEEIYKTAKESEKKVELEILTKRIAPNKMQAEALENLEALRKDGKKKALIISATGTGKTFLSAFDVERAKSKKMLFVVHRLNIAKKAMESFKKVFGKSKRFGLYSGDKRDLNADFIFSTIQTLSKEGHLSKFEKAQFDYIIIDESHRTGADSYLRLMQYFEPKFLLGMTATPERTDGYDIFSLFDHNIAYEIRLNKAMEEDMLCQFHYYGITELKVNNEKMENTKDFNIIATDERVEKIIEKAELYGSDNGEVRGLVFCSRNREASLLSDKFNKFGLRTRALSGDNSEEEREEAIRCLESNNQSEKLDYIFTVDIFNEGIDIPSINQILMIRPTESAIIFVQQLGRGLRKTNGKEYLTIIDFIGNHKNSYLIPIALYGDTSFNKDTLRKLMSEGSKLIPGASTINFDQITKERIFESIDSANMRLLSDLKKDYQLLKYRLGRIPLMVDFLIHGSRNPFLYVEYSKSYYNFLCNYEKDFDSELDLELVELLELFSREINNAKRIEESYILKKLLLNESFELSRFKREIKEIYGYDISDAAVDSCLTNLNFMFINKTKSIVVLKAGNFKFHDDFCKILKQNSFKQFLMDSVEYSLRSFDLKYTKDLYRNGLVLFNKYSRKDVCRLLNWEKDISSTVYGYRTKNGVTPCFVTYNKSGDIEESINYNDHFINLSQFAWESRSNRRLTSSEIQNVINSERILLFVKKSDGEGTDFYFIGDCSIMPDSVRQDTMPESNLPVVHFTFKLEQTVPKDLYNYLTSNNQQYNQPLEYKGKQTINLAAEGTAPFGDK